jgi:peptidoglycan/xylan/chitin deacetylase (PgdA/CDA1 family)
MRLGDGINGIVWTFHRIAPRREAEEIHDAGRGYNFPPDELEALLAQALGKGYRFVSIAEFMDNLRCKSGSARDIAITIDDGFKSVCEYAYPVFKKFGVPFAFFVSSGLIDRGFSDCVRLEGEGLQAVFDIVYDSEVISLDGVAVPSKTLDEKRNALAAIRATYAEKKRSGAMDGARFLSQMLGRKIDFERYRKDYICSWRELAEMSKDKLCTIGSHSMRHDKLAEIGVQDADFQLEASRKIISEHIGKPVEYLSYPYGVRDARTIRLARKHYAAAFATNGRCTRYGDTPFSLPRKTVMPGMSLDDVTSRVCRSRAAKAVVSLLCALVPVRKWRRLLRNALA